MTPVPSTGNNLGVELPSDLSKLTVSQLKALCKERRIVGYSKLGKAALLRKLAELTSGPSLSRADHPRVVSAPLPVARHPQALPSHEPAASTDPGTHISQIGTTVRASTSIATSQQPLPGLEGGKRENMDSPVSVENAPILKRVSIEMTQGPVQTECLVKKLKIAQVGPQASAAPEMGNSVRVSTLLIFTKPTMFLFFPSFLHLAQHRCLR
jgi:hypothetical protein